jgi:hypothetical protein
MIGDTFLSVNTPVQVAVPDILAAAKPLAEPSRSRVAANYALLGADEKEAQSRLMPMEVEHPAVPKHDPTKNGLRTF